jgi:GT2 family glycosyltransferase
MRAVILVPRRDDNGHRDKLWEFCKQKWVDNYEDMPIFEGYHNDGPFNRSAAINRASEMAGDWDVALIIDSDTVSEVSPVMKALELAYRTNGLVVAHTHRHMLHERATMRILAGEKGTWNRGGMVQRTYRDSVSCAVAISRKTWDAVGGFDERFIGWGFEDTAFNIACETVSGLLVTAVPGACYHLWHPVGPEANRNSMTFKRNHSLKRRYEGVRGHPDRLRRMLGLTQDQTPVGTIPRILHRTVPEVTSDQVEAWWDRFAELHPDWDLRTYREPIDPKEWPMTGDLFQKCQNGAQKAGLIRLEAIYTHGGVYVDSDVEPMRPFDPLLHLPAFAGWEDEKVVPDAVLGCAKEHPAFLELIGRARTAVSEGQDAWNSGPGGTTEILPKRDDVLVLPPGAFYPAHYLEKAKLGKNGDKPWVFCEHKWHHSWGSAGAKASIAQNQRIRVKPIPAPVLEPVLDQSVQVAICVPWNDTDDEWRRASWTWCYRWWTSNAFTVYTGNGPSRSAMRNAAAADAIADGFNVLFFADADTWVPINQVVHAATAALAEQRLVHAFDTYTRLQSAATKTHMASDRPDVNRLSRLGSRQRNHMSGASAISVQLFKDLGGYDERFTGWGFEDRAFDYAARTIGGSVGRITGPAIHWFHNPADGKELRPSKDDFATDLMIRYCIAAATVPATRVGALAGGRVPKDARPDPDAMRAILREPDGPLSASVVPPVVVL